MKKYELLVNDTKQIGSKTLYRIKRLGDGVIGGYIEKESNLSHEGTCWVHDNAWVYDNARVFSNARVHGDARVSGDAKVRSVKDCYFFMGESYHITVTPQNVSIGCKVKTHKQWLKVTKKQAVEMGLAPELYNIYKELVKTGIKAVTRK
jgi:hypothetical protein